MVATLVVALSTGLSQREKLSGWSNVMEIRSSRVRSVSRNSKFPEFAGARSTRVIQRAVRNVHFPPRFRSVSMKRPSFVLLVTSAPSNGRALYYRVTINTSQRDTGEGRSASSPPLLSFVSHPDTEHNREAGKKAGKKKGGERRRRDHAWTRRVCALLHDAHIARPCEPRANNGSVRRGAGAPGLRMCVCASRTRVRGHARASFSFLSWGIRQELLPLA